MMLTQAPKGTKDILPSEVYKWHYIEKEIAKLCHDLAIRKSAFPYLNILNFSNGESGYYGYCTKGNVHFSG